jgi:hypothetical protein
MWFWIIVLGIAIPIVVVRLKGQSAEKRAGYGARCQFCRARLKYNADRTGWARVCRKCGRSQTGA